MPSPEHAASLERLLTRAAIECESKHGIWFGAGLPEALRSALELRGDVDPDAPAAVGFIEVGEVSVSGHVRATDQTAPPGLRLVGLTSATFDSIASLFESTASSGLHLDRLITPFAVFDFTPDGVQVREIRHGLTARDLQAKMTTPLWAGPDLCEMGSH